MKKVIIVSKTHLDLGFTDYAENIRRKYIDEFIPSAISLAQEINTTNKKSFIWTTGSWIIKEALENGTEIQRKNLEDALKRGDIVPHGLPFTTHSELFDEDTFDFGLSIVDRLDDIRGKKTVSAKMTDVPGHTQGIVPLLAKHGIKLLHIGVNGVSAVPEVPECFLWKCNGAEVIVVYSGDYGGAFKSEFADEVLYFDHTLDNHGAPAPDKVLSKLAKIQKEYPGYEVSAGTLDEFAEVIWNVRDKLPVFEGEIGDTWIHGSASDPYKSASLRRLMRLKSKWLSNGTMTRDSEEYKDFSDALLCIGEHTCGMDSKMYFADYENYLKPDFQKARETDNIKIRHLFRNFPHNLLTAISRCTGAYNKGSYRVIEKSWQEQREYIDKAVSALNAEHKAEAKKQLALLRPTDMKVLSSDKTDEKEFEICGYKMSLNEYGGIEALSYNGDEIIRCNGKALIEYRSYNDSDYDYWFKHYSRNMDINFGWGFPDFGRPLLKYERGKYPVGRFFYKMSGYDVQKMKDSICITVDLKCDRKICDELGAPRYFQVVYTLGENGLSFDVSWFGKDANRLTEAIFLHLFPVGDELKLIKVGSEIDYKSTASMGGKNLSAVEKSILKTDSGAYSFINYDCPLISIGRGKILEYDNIIEDINKDGISYVLCNNVWGTNFPLWYEENAMFSFEIKPDKE